MLLTQMEQISEDVTRKIGPLYFTARTAQICLNLSKKIRFSFYNTWYI